MRFRRRAPLPPSGLDHLLAEQRAALETAAADAAAGPDRLGRLAGGVEKAQRRRADGRTVQKTMNLLGVLVLGAGLGAVLLGWYGASHSPALYQEIPYLISGGLLGVALVVAGGALFCASWSLRQIQEARRDTQGVVRAIERLERTLRAGPAGVSINNGDRVAERLVEPPSSGARLR
jgi:hypothetical protein